MRVGRWRRGRRGSGGGIPWRRRRRRLGTADLSDGDVAKQGTGEGRRGCLWPVV
jgi:hypothetical protein